MIQTADGAIASDNPLKYPMAQQHHMSAVIEANIKPRLAPC
jgi:hypothetical protein